MSKYHVSQCLLYAFVGKIRESGLHTITLLANCYGSHSFHPLTPNDSVQTHGSDMERNRLDEMNIFFYLVKAIRGHAKKIPAHGPKPGSSYGPKPGAGRT